MKKINITKESVDALPYVEKGLVNGNGNPVYQIDYFDRKLKGFGVRVGTTSKTYFVMNRVNGKLTRVKIGSHGVFTATNARKEAGEVLASLGHGVDLNKEKSEKRAEQITLEQALEEYVVDRVLRPNTILDYRKVIRLYASDWKNKALADITTQMIKDRHRKVANEVGPIPANKLGRYLRLLFNYSMKHLGLKLDGNPVALEWKNEPRKKSFLKASQVPVWVKAVSELPSPVMQDCFMFLFYTGLRKDECLSLSWDMVDLENGYFTVLDSVAKNGDELNIPITRQLATILKRRAALRENDFVFPSTGKTGHLVNPDKQVNALEKITGFRITPHDLRRTFLSHGENEVSYMQLKRLVNHSTKSDVTAGYIILEVEQLRRPAQKIADVLEMLSTGKQADVIQLYSRHVGD
jgi:integrase